MVNSRGSLQLLYEDVGYFALCCLLLGFISYQQGLLEPAWMASRSPVLGYLKAERVNCCHVVPEVKDCLYILTSLEEVMGVSARKWDLKRLQVKNQLGS